MFNLQTISLALIYVKVEVNKIVGIAKNGLTSRDHIYTAGQIVFICYRAAIGDFRGWKILGTRLVMRLSKRPFAIDTKLGFGAFPISVTEYILEHISRNTYNTKVPISFVFPKTVG